MLPAVCLCLASLVLLPQDPAPRPITTPVATVNGEFSAISSVRELRDGRLLVSDRIDRTVKLIDPRTGATRKIGTNGEGPGEYLQPGGLYPATGDSTWLLDRGQPRYLLIDPSGRIVDTRSFATAGVRTISTGGTTDRQRIDTEGRLYSIGMAGMTMGGARSPSGVSVDSAPLVRQDLARDRSDSLARLLQPEMSTSRSGQVTIRMPTMFSPADDWALQPDGRVAVVRAAPYRVEWFDAAGRRTTEGPVIPYEVHRVTNADREAAVKAQETALRRAELPRLSMGSGTPVQMTMPDMSGQKFADVKPPFQRNGVISGPDGQVWVRRTLARGDSSAVYDVIDARGERVDRLRFPARTSIVGFGANNTVYVARLDEDDVPTLEKYSIARR